MVRHLSAIAASAACITLALWAHDRHYRILAAVAAGAMLAPAAVVLSRD